MSLFPKSRHQSRLRAGTPNPKIKGATSWQHHNIKC